MMILAGVLFGLGIMPPGVIWMLVGGGAVLAVLLAIFQVRRQGWSLPRAILYALFFAVLGFGLGYGLVWFLHYQVNTHGFRLFSIPSSTR